MKVAVYTGTRNLYPHMIPAVKSLLCNSDVDKVYLFIEDDVFPFELPENGIVETRNVSGQQYFKIDGPNMGSRFTYMAMMRTALSKEFPELDKILSLDVDTIVRDDISGVWDLWALPIDDYYLSASIEPDRSDDSSSYFNIGVMVQNLKKMREDGIDDLAIKLLNEKEYKFLEQDVYNEICAGKIYDMPAMYNVCDYTKKVFGARKIVHFAGYPDWTWRKEYKEYSGGGLSWPMVLGIRKSKYGK